MRAIILVSAVFIYDALMAQSNAKKETDEEKKVHSAVFWIALIYAIILDLTE